MHGQNHIKAKGNMYCVRKSKVSVGDVSGVSRRKNKKGTYMK